MKRSHLRRSVGALGLAAVGILVLAGALAAHDFWIVPNAFAISDGGTIEVRGQTGIHFPTSVSAVTPDRIADARVIGASGDEGEWEVAFATLVFSVSGGNTSGASRPASDSADVVAVVTRYQNALATGDSSAALALLAADAVVLESGGVETRAEYRSHHLPADMSFARGVPSVRANLRVAVRGDVAWVSSTSTSRGEFRGRQINSSGAELMVLSREPDGWKIRAIHWSSRNRNP